MHQIFPDIISEALLITGKEPLSKSDKMNIKAKNTAPGH
jgi:hypothetical protein